MSMAVKTTPKSPSTAMRVALVYDMDGCRGPTGVTRHALAQLERLARRPEIGADPGRGADDRARRPGLLGVARAPCRGASCRCGPATSCAGGGWPWPPVEWWSGPVDWVYCPAEYVVADPSGAPRGDQPRRLAEPRYGSSRVRRAAGADVRPGRPDPVGLAVQHRAAPEGVPRAARAAWRTSPTPPRTCSSSRPSAARAGLGPGRPGAAARGPLPALGGQLPAEEEPGPADPGGGAAPRGGAAASWPWCCSGPAPRPRPGRSARRSRRPAAAP